MLSAVIGTGPHMSRRVSWHALMASSTLSGLAVTVMRYQLPSRRSKLKQKKGGTGRAHMYDTAIVLRKNAGPNEAIFARRGREENYPHTSTPHSATQASSTPTLRMRQEISPIEPNHGQTLSLRHTLFGVVIGAAGWVDLAGLCEPTHLVRWMLASYVSRFCSRTTENNRLFSAWITAQKWTTIESHR